MNHAYKVIDEQRMRRGLTWGRLAKLTGLRPQLFSKWKHGEQEPGMRSLIVLADFFGLSLDQCVGRIPVPASAPGFQKLNSDEEATLFAMRGSPGLRRIFSVILKEWARDSNSPVVAELPKKQ